MAVPTWRGLATYYVLFFVQLETRRVTLAGIARHPTAEWMLQMSRNATGEDSGHLRGQRYLLHDRDTKFCPAFRDVLESAGGLSKLILPGVASLRRALTEYIAHFHSERNHQGKANQLLFPARAPDRSGIRTGVRCDERLGGLLKYYRREAA